MNRPNRSIRNVGLATLALLSALGTTPASAEEWKRSCARTLSVKAWASWSAPTVGTLYFCDAFVIHSRSNGWACGFARGSVMRSGCVAEQYLREPFVCQYNYC